MIFSGIAKIDRRTKNLVKRLKPGDIAVIMHEDLDMVAAENLVACKPRAVINCHSSISGKYVNRGPYLLIDAGIPLIDNAGDELASKISEGDRVDVVGGEIRKNGAVLATGAVADIRMLNARNQLAKEHMGEVFENFAANTLAYLDKEKSLLYSNLNMGSLRLDFRGRQALIVVRGSEFKKDLDTLRQYIHEQGPVLIAVDGGADALIEFGFKPNIILGDMDSVTDAALRCGAILIVHAYEGGEAPGMERLNSLGLEGIPIPSIGTSEDLALLLAFERGAELITIVGSHFSVEEFLSKGRGGMASTFLTRLRVGSVLVDAKGISKLYQNKVRPMLLIYLAAAAAFPIAAIFLVSPLGPLTQQFMRLLKLMFNM
ncbi:MAG TPA: putative cytokinetic ring protein SteA [bacterium]|nr:putative cytokinetic ring protein SteA [bacterium]